MDKGEMYRSAKTQSSHVKVDRTGFSCVGSLVTSARVMLYIHRARFEKQNNMAAQYEVAFLQLKKKIRVQLKLFQQERFK